MGMVINMKRAIKLPPLEELDRILSYEPTTGDFRWKVSINSYRGKTVIGGLAGFRRSGYILIGIGGREYRAHRLAWFMHHGSPPEFDIDHKNGVKDDNRIGNLRDVRHRLNIENQRAARADGGTGLLGVSYHKRAKKFSAQIRYDGRKKHLGLFVTAREAHDAYLAAKRAHHAGCTI